MNANMKVVYERFKNEKDFLILSHTSDPGTDSAARLKKYADSLSVDTGKWIFLTGTRIVFTGKPGTVIKSTILIITRLMVK
jgi:protein SCO1/2